MISVERRPGGEGRAAVVLMHGRGADEHDLLGLAEVLDPDRHFHWYLPRGPLALAPGGAHWYAVERVGYPDAATFAQGYAELCDFVDALPHDEIVLGGFSQGAVMAFAAGLGVGRPRPAGVMAFSGFIPQVAGWQLETAQPFPPLAIGHGSDDVVIPVEFSHRALAALEAAGATDVLYRESPMGHAIDPQFLVELRPWLVAALG